MNKNKKRISNQTIGVNINLVVCEDKRTQKSSDICARDIDLHMFAMLMREQSILKTAEFGCAMQGLSHFTILKDTPEESNICGLIHSQARQSMT